jgi:hypothetical protein
VTRNTQYASRFTRHHLMASFAEERTIRPLRLRFFDLDVRIRSDDEACLDLFARMYRQRCTTGAHNSLVVMTSWHNQEAGTISRVPWLAKTDLTRRGE